MRALFLFFYLLSAEQADYDGDAITFNGHFKIEHAMGTLSSDSAQLKNPKLHRTGKSGSHLYLENNVLIEAQKGTLPFTLSSKRGDGDLPPHTLFSQFQFQEFHFYEEVEIRSLKDLQASGGSALYKTGSLTLYPAIPAAHCHLFRGGDKIDAKWIRFDLFKEELTCEAAQVHLLSTLIEGKESFALADSLVYLPRENRLILSCSAPKRVLFWQEGLSLSAPEVIIGLKPQESVEGRGDVHFSFDLDEKYEIEQLFSKYL